MKSAIITGVSGQDGSYLAELLLERGYRVCGVVRKVSLAESKLGNSLSSSLKLHEWDFSNQARISEIIKEEAPAEIYNLAAYSSGVGMYDEPLNIADVNGLVVTRLLEAIKNIDSKIKICQASSREIFGEPTISPQNEETKKNPRSPYGAAKLYADSMIRIYRERYNIFACSAILFNHESPRRGLNFVTRKITYEAARIKLGYANELHLGNLDTARDWGFAGDTVKAMWMMLQHSKADDYVIATGKTHTIREFCDYVFTYLGLNYRDYVKEDVSNFRPSESVTLVGDVSKIRRTLNWSPAVNFDQLIKMMVDADIHLLRNIDKTV